MLGHTFVDSSAMVDGKLPRFKVSSRYNHTLFSREDYGALDSCSGSTDSTDRKDRVCVQLPKFPPKSTPSHSCSSPRSNDLSSSESVQTIMSIFQTPQSLGNACSSVFERTSFKDHNHDQTTTIKTEFHFDYKDADGIPPDIIASSLAEGKDGLRRPCSQTDRKETQQKQQQQQQVFSDESNRTSEESVRVTQSAPIDNSSEKIGKTGKQSNHNTFVDQSERISRLDDVVAELSTKMLQLRDGSSCVMSNLERTMQLLTQVKASLETVYRNKADWPRVDGCTDCNDPTMDNERGTHKSSSTTVSDISQDSAESFYPGKKLNIPPVAVKTQKHLTPNPSRSKSQQWDPAMFSNSEQVDRCLTTSHSTYEVSGHLAPDQSPLSPKQILISTTNDSISDKSGFASPLPTQKPTRRSALQLAAAIFRTSSRDRNSTPKCPSHCTSSSVRSSKFFKFRSLSKEPTALKSAETNSSRSLVFR